MRSTVSMAVLVASGQAMAQPGGSSYVCRNAVGSSPAAWTVSSNTSNYKFETMTYVGHADGQAQSLDLYLPPGVVDPPLLAVVHGGGFTGGTRKKFVSYVQPYVAQGYAVADISYRLAGTFDTTDAGRNPSGVVNVDSAANVFPAAVQDVRCAERRILVGNCDHAGRRSCDILPHAWRGPHRCAPRTGQATKLG